MTTILNEIGDLRDSSEDLQIFVRLANDERDPDKKREWQHKARLALGAVKARTKTIDSEIGGWQ